jgi:hypothetical protein
VQPRQRLVAGICLAVLPVLAAVAVMVAGVVSERDGLVYASMAFAVASVPTTVLGITWIVRARSAR